MKLAKTYLLALAALLIFNRCEESIVEESEIAPSLESADLNESSLHVPSHRFCASMDVLQQNLEADPGLAENMARIEQFINQQIKDENQERVAKKAITIPVVVHVLYRSNKENISRKQILSQIDVLNEDFNANNSDLSLTPKKFEDEIGNFRIKFKLDRITRTYANKKSWNTNDAMKKPSKGGIAPISPKTKLNVWVVNALKGGVLGYAQFPGGARKTDGIVVAHNYFGRTGRVSAPFDRGRTATHEVGHWLNLRHIWGDGGCNQDDFVSDTPKSNQPNYGCPAYPTRHCKSVDMTMNYMDYTNDACMYMFTNGQKRRGRAIFKSGGPRASFANG